MIKPIPEPWISINRPEKGILRDLFADLERGTPGIPTLTVRKGGCSMNTWTCALDKKALKMGVLKLPDMRFTCPGCKRKVDREEGLYIRTTSLCSLCTELKRGKSSGTECRSKSRFRAVPAWFIPGLR